MGLRLLLANLAIEQAYIAAENKAKVEEAKYRYFNSGHLPRKAKKKAKKEALKDYVFWKGISEWHDNMMNPFK